MLLSITRKISIIAALIGLGTSSAQADLIWDWTGNGGQDTGYFITDGDMSGGSLAAGTYTVSDFGLTTTGFSDLDPLEGGTYSGGDFTIPQGDLGFIWDGSAITTYFRLSGAFTNGSTLQASSSYGPYNLAYFTFSTGGYSVYDNDYSPLNQGMSLSMTPSQYDAGSGGGGTVPLPPTLLLMLPAMAWLGRRSARAGG